MKKKEENKVEKRELIQNLVLFVANNDVLFYSISILLPCTGNLYLLGAVAVWVQRLFYSM